MNPSHRDSWPPGQTQGQGSPPEARSQPPRQYQPFGSSPAHQQNQLSQSPGNAPVLPPPGSLYQPNSALPTLSSLSQGPSHTSGSQSTQQLPSLQAATGGQASPQRLQQFGEGDRGYTMTEPRDAERHPAPDVRMRDAELELDSHERQRLEAAQIQGQAQPQETHAGSMPLHQPVAVAPVRSIHGPNGILGGAATASGNNQVSMGPQLGPSNVFPSPHSSQAEPARNSQLQPATQTTAQQQAYPTNAVANQAVAVGQGQQPILNDALSYLDQVKVQFADKADVYNKFLDIMKDFKSGAIDTPGVIDRVSNLFAGNPSLIQGFNTFLPPGYKIECGTGDNPNAIRVTTPMGTTTSQLPSRPLSNPIQVALGTNGFYDGESRNPNTSWQPRAGANSSDLGYGNDRRNAPGSYGASLVQGLSAPLSPDAQRTQQASGTMRDMMQQDQRGVSQLQDAASVVGAGQGALSTGMSAATGIEKRPQVEFNHAINYVNKIKNRFATQPDIYKQFLEILQTYQRESKPIQEVYGQVTQLFQSAPDLLNDFKQFLPESAAPAARDEFPISNLRGDTSHLASGPAQLHTPRADSSRMPPVGNFAPTPNTGREQKRKRQDKVATSSTTVPTPDPAVPAAVGRNVYTVGNHANKRPKYQHAVKAPTTSGQDLAPLSPTLAPSLPVPLPPTTTMAATQEDFHFFDRVKKAISNKGVMSEFLKLCNLYAEGLADKNVIYGRAHQFIGHNPELMTQFAGFLGYEDQDNIIENRPRSDQGRVALTQCRSYGPSYRLLPKLETQALCSGRDELCKSVLNDEWASHPTWASEDSGFVAHRKNTHEEGLHRIEEERHDYDFNIEACSRTVQLLENVCQQLYNSPPLERETFELPDTLGGASTTIYRRVIMKIYGREHGLTVIETMFQRPYQILPIVYGRIKSRLEEWKAAQREWEKVWREQTQKIFWRSLDHQSSNAKNADKRQFQAKTLRDEIVAKQAEMYDKRQKGTLIEKKYQFRYDVSDELVVLDAAKLVLAWAVTNLGDPAATSFEDFLKDFVCTFFGTDRAKVEAALVLDEYPPSSDEAEGTTPGDSDGGARRVNGRGASLRKDLLDPRGRKGYLTSRQESVASGSRASTPGIPSGVEEDNGPATDVDEDVEMHSDHDKDEKNETWLNIISGGINPLLGQNPDDKGPRTQYTMYCDQHIYSFLRMFLIFYERLNNLKKSEDAVRDQVKKAMAPKPAVELLMIDKFPSDFFNDVSDSANYYEQLLHLFQDSLRETGDMSQIEEILRRYYLDCGWQLYSLDKLVSSLARFGQAVKSSPESKESSLPIWLAFKKERAKPEYSFNELVAYRNNAVRLINNISKDSDTFKVVWDDAGSKVYISLVRRDDPTINLSELDKLKLWHAYQATYKEVAPTEGVSVSRVRVPFVLSGKEPLDALPGLQEEHSDDIKVAISQEGYKLEFKHNGREWIHKLQIKGAPAEDITSFETNWKAAEDRSAAKFLTGAEWMKDMTEVQIEELKSDFTAAVNGNSGDATAGNAMEVEQGST